MRILNPDIDAVYGDVKHLEWNGSNTVGFKGAAAKLERYLSDYSFADVATTANLVEWEKTMVGRSGVM